MHAYMKSAVEWENCMRTTCTIQHSYRELLRYEHGSVKQINYIPERAVCSKKQAMEFQKLKVFQQQTHDIRQRVRRGLKNVTSHFKPYAPSKLRAKHTHTHIHTYIYTHTHTHTYTHTHTHIHTHTHTHTYSYIHTHTHTHTYTHTHTHTHTHIYIQVTARPCTSTVFSSDGSITLPDVTHGCLKKKLRWLQLVSVPGETDAKESAVVNAAECRSFSRMLQFYSAEEWSLWPNNLAFGAPLVWRRHLPRWKYEESHNSCGLLLTSLSFWKNVFLFRIIFAAQEK